MILVKSIPLNIASKSSIHVEIGYELNGAVLKDSIAELLNLQSSTFNLYRNTQIVNNDDTLYDGDVVHLHFPIKGGKGGFGSMLRAIGAQIEKTTNKEACRDLSGRRLRDINEEQRLKKWIAKQAERERERAERKQQRLQRLQAKPRTDFHDPEYDKVRSNLASSIDSALTQGLKVSQDESSSSGKRKLADNVNPTKKLKGWSEELSSGSSSDEDETNSSENDSAPSTSAALNENSKDSQTFESTEVVSENDSNDVQYPEHSGATSKEADCTDESQSNSTFAFESKEHHDIDLDAISSIEELETLGLERIKQALMKRGMKCGGTLHQRAERLFSIKGKTEIDSNLLAKPRK